MLPLTVRLTASVFLAFILLWAVILLGPDTQARIATREDIVHVLPRSGLWYHQYTITARRAPDSVDAKASSSRSEQASSASSLAQVTFRATQSQYDELRTGALVRIHRLPLTRFAWVVDESVLLGALRALGARTVQYRSPHSVPPALGSLSGLARVVSVHRIAPTRNRFRSNNAAGSQGLDLIVVEFWAQGLRTLVRTVDVVDARSIDDLGPGQILQMHYDQRTPRSMRLDDGMRTYVEKATDR